MDSLPEAVSLALTHIDKGRLLREWLIEHCFIDLAATPDCAGGLVLLASNPIVRDISDWPSRKLPDGREVFGIRLVPRSGCSLETIRVRFSELRPDGISQMRDVCLDALGEAELVIPQEAWEVALEVSCNKRGLLSAPVYAGFFRSIGFETRLVRRMMSVEVPARNKRQDGSRFEVPVTDARLTVTQHVGTAAENDAAAQLAGLLRGRTAPMGVPANEVIFSNDRQFAVSFVRRLVSQSASRVLFVDPYFSVSDIRDFALSAWSGSCQISILTGASGDWSKPLGHLAKTVPHGELMDRDLAEINRIRNINGISSINVAVMVYNQVHDRFLVVDDTVWFFGNSFKSLGDGSLSMASKVRDVPALLPMLFDVLAKAESFSKFWKRTKRSLGVD